MDANAYQKNINRLLWLISLRTMGNDVLAVLFIGMIWLPLPVSAQFFPSQDVSWQGVTWSIAGPIPYYQALCGDTTINEQIYSKFYGYSINSQGEEEAQYLAAIRVSGPRVWIIEQGSNSEIILYDFSLEAGDQITLEYIGQPGQITVKVAAVSTIQMDGEFVKVIEFVPVSGTEESWIEGVGSTRGPVFRSFTAVDATSDLTCFRKEEELIYRTVPENECDFNPGCTLISSLSDQANKLPLQLYPTISQGALTFQNGTHSTVQLEAYDMNGRQIGIWESLPMGLSELNISNWHSGMYHFSVRDLNKNIYLQHFRITLFK
jgi:hypothetical protein